MDRSATPWRVLDDTPQGESAGNPGAAPPGDSASPSALPHLSWSVVGGFALAVALAVGAFAVAASSPSGDIVVEGGAAWGASGSPRASDEASPSDRVLAVDVQGAVLHPGLRELAPGSRIGDAIAAAGGYGPRVDAERAGRDLNLAAALKDGDRIVVPSRDDPPVPSGPDSPQATGNGAGGPAGVVDLNSATAAELDELPGVGPVTAQKIIDARDEKPFATVEELRDRKIIGSSTFEKLRDLVTVN